MIPFRILFVRMVAIIFVLGMNFFAVMTVVDSLYVVDKHVIDI